MTHQPPAKAKAADRPQRPANRMRSAARRPMRSLKAGMASRPAAEPTEPTATARWAALSERPRSCPSCTMTGLNSSTAGLARAVARNKSRYCRVLSICTGVKSRPARFAGAGAFSGFSSRALPAAHTASIRPPSTQKQTRMPHRPLRKRTRRVSAAPERPTAPPMTPVARPFFSAYHFWAQPITAG